MVLPLQAQATDLPFETDFEGPEFVSGFLSDTFYSGPLTIQVVDDIAASGKQSLEILGRSTVDFEIDDLLSVGIRWVDFYVKPVFSVATDLPEMIAGLRSAVSAFVVQEGQGLVYVVHGNGSGSGTWVSSGYPVVLEDNKAKDWMRMSYRLDYASKTWDLYLDDRLVLFDLGFMDHTLTRLDALSLQLSDDRSTHVDFLYVGMEIHYSRTKITMALKIALMPTFL